MRLQPQEMAFKRNGDLYPLRSGVQITSAIITGQRSVMSLLIDPFFSSGVHPLPSVEPRFLS